MSGMGEQLGLSQTSGEGRTQLFKDLFAGIKPQRVPLTNSSSVEFSIAHAGLNIAEVLWDLPKLEYVLDKACRDFISDTVPIGGIRIPSYYQILGSRPIVMSSSGFMQHPEVVGLLAEEYDEFISSPYNCIVEKIIPRLYTALDTEPDKKALTLAKAMKAYCDDYAVLGDIRAKLIEKYGLASLSSVTSEAPFDFVADFLRGFKGIIGDLRRYPGKVAAACEAILPYLIKKGSSPDINNPGFVFLPLHMAPYLRPNDFEKFYWPTFKALVEAFVEAGKTVNLFVESDWMRYLPYLYELPENTVMRFEFGEPGVVKKELGERHILSGFYPATLLQTGSKQQCLDQAKELLEILAPGGRYWFQLDKQILPCNNTEKVANNLQAVLQYVYDNGKY